MKKITPTIALLTLSINIASAQVYAYFNKDPSTISSGDYSSYTTNVKSRADVAGITVLINWADYDNGNPSGPPLLGSLTTLEAHLNAAIRTGQKINLIIAAATGNVQVAGMNAATPTYVSSINWANSCCSGVPLDVCWCHNYQGSGTDGWTWTNSNCYNRNNYPTGSGAHSFDPLGAPAAWEQPFVTAYTGWLKQFLPRIATDLGATLGYIRIGVGTGGGSVIPCPAVEAFAYPYNMTRTQTSGPTPPLNALSVWHAYNNVIYATAQAYASGTTMEASMYGDQLLGSNDGTVPIGWADDVAATAVANHLGIGAESLAATDMALYASASACSNDWCNLFNEYSLSAPMLGLQTLSISDPDCLTNPSCGNQTGSLATVLPFGTQRHARIFEVAYEDLLCAYDSTYSNPPYCSTGAGISTYPTALNNATNGSPSSTATVVGSAKLSNGSIN